MYVYSANDLAIESWRFASNTMPYASGERPISRVHHLFGAPPMRLFFTSQSDNLFEIADDTNLKDPVADFSRAI